MITVFYDGKCGLCSKEINRYKKIAPEGVFNWQDITRSTAALKKEGIMPSDGLRLLHAKDDRGKLHVGVDAFVLIWLQLARWKVLAQLVSLPIIRQAADALYRAFADWRFARLPHCQAVIKKEKP